MAKTLMEILKEKGIPINSHYGGELPEELTEREINKEPFSRSKN